MRRLLALTLTLALMLPGCAPAPQGEGSASSSGTQLPAVSQPEPEPEPEPIVSTLMVAGDVMSHMPITNDAYVEATGEYDYSHMLQFAADQLEDCLLYTSRCV